MAGKNLSADKCAFAAVRVMPPCFAVGEAVGYTSALAVKNGKSPKEIDVCAVQNLILENGGYLG